MLSSSEENPHSDNFFLDNICMIDSSNLQVLCVSYQKPYADPLECVIGLVPKGEHGLNFIA